MFGTTILAIVMGQMVTLYPKSAVVTEVNVMANTVTTMDGAGNLWSFYGTEDWEYGDICSMIMSDNGTPDNIYDDMILNCQYGGFVY